MIREDRHQGLSTKKLAPCDLCMYLLWHEVSIFCSVLFLVIMSLKPSEPVHFDSRRDALAANTWLYQVDVYLNVVLFVNP